MGADPVTGGALLAATGISSIGGMASSMMGAYGQEKATDEATKRQMEMNNASIASNEKIAGNQLANTAAQQKADWEAYNASRATGATDMTAGENAFTTEANTPNAELGTMEADIKNKIHI